MRPLPAPSKYVQQLLQDREPATPGSTVQQELQELKAQITDAAAALDLERQAYQRARVRSSAQQMQVLRSEMLMGQQSADMHARAMHVARMLNMQSAITTLSGRTFRPKVDWQQASG